MRSSALRKYCCLAFVPLGLFVFSVQAHTFAQGYPVEEESDNNFGLAIDPPYNSLELENNRFGEVTIKVENTNPFNIYVTPSVRDINIIDNQPQFVPLEDAEYPLSPFLEFSIEQFLIKEGESVDFTIEVVPPDDDPSEFLFGAVFFTASYADLESTAPNVSSNVVYHPGLGSIILVSFPDNFGKPFSKNGSIENFEASEKVYFSGLASFNLDYENTGTTFYIPEGTVEVRGWSGKLKDRAVLDSHFIFPQSIQNYDFAWPYEQELVGYYNVTVSFADGEGNIDTETVGIWIISMWDMVIFLLILIVVSLTLYLFAKYRGKKKKRRK